MGNLHFGTPELWVGAKGVLAAANLPPSHTKKTLGTPIYFRNNALPKLSLVPMSPGDIAAQYQSLGRSFSG
jgi:hypothetical protein